jgi:transposase
MYSTDLKRIALNLYYKINSLRKVAQIIETSHSTISRWKNYTARGRKEINGKLQTKPILDAISLYVMSHPFTDCNDLKKMIKTQFDLEISKELVRLSIKKLGFTRKRARYCSYPKHYDEKLEMFLKLRSSFVQQGREFVSIDETSFGRNFKPASGYSLKGKRLMIQKKFVRITNQSVVSAASLNKLFWYQQPKPFTSQTFIGFLKTLPFPEKTVILLDNVSFHHSKCVKDLCQDKGWDILYIPPYSPIFNPIEGIFSIVKRHFQKFTHISNAFESVQIRHLQNFFRGSFQATQCVSVESIK